MTEKCQLFVNTLDGKSIKILINFNDKVISIKNLILQKIGIEIYKQRLVYCGQEMKDERVINSYNIAVQSSIHLVILGEKNKGVKKEKKIKIDNTILDLILEMKKNFNEIIWEYKLLKSENEKLKKIISDNM